MMVLSGQNFFNKMHTNNDEKKTDDVTLTMGKLENQAEKDAYEMRKLSQRPACFDKVILDPEWKLMSAFMFIMIIFSTLSSFFSAYFACFGEPESGSVMVYLDTVMEVAFIIDLFKNFFTQYTDPRQLKPVRDLFKITVNYLKGPFFFDFLAILAWPMREIFRNSWSQENIGLLYLLRIFRISKILILLNL